MTRAEIIAELRRSAREDADPWDGVDVERAWAELCARKIYGECMSDLKKNDCRTFFLLVACALEDEC